MMYTGLAGVYDKLTDDFDYDEWARYYASLIRRICPGARSLIDCGCGTGSLAVRLSQLGFEVMGVDISEDMLSVASGKARRAGVEIRFVRQDMTKLEMPRPMDALICACDGVNYLTDARAADAFFARAARALKPGGAFAFDISNSGKLRKMGAARVYCEDRDDLSYIWLNDWDERAEKLVMRLSCFVKQPNGLYQKFTETHVQRAHKTQALAEALARAGFGDISVFGGDEGGAPGPGGERAYLCCRRL